MNRPTIPGFDYGRAPGADGIELNVATGGSGPAVVLLHGFPQTHLMWRHVAGDLAHDHSVVCPDLRGYGASDKPVADTADAYSKRTMARDVVAAAASLGHADFVLAGHDRGALVAFRAALDHPRAVRRLVVLDVLPTLDMWDVLRGSSAAVAWHLYLMAQPPGLPEQMISASADAFFAGFLDGWGSSRDAIPDDVREEYLRASRDAVASIVADYRASATVDIEHDATDREAGARLAMPTTVVQQDWGDQLGFDAAALWRAWAPQVDHRTLDAGHFMAEQSPCEIAAIIRGTRD